MKATAAMFFFGEKIGGNMPIDETSNIHPALMNLTEGLPGLTKITLDDDTGNIRMVINDIREI